LNVVQYLLKSPRAADLAKQQMKDGRDALQMASNYGHHEVVRVLKASGLFETSSANKE
jgi:ankyrin repeat protein